MQKMSEFYFGGLKNGQKINVHFSLGQNKILKKI